MRQQPEEEKEFIIPKNVQAKFEVFQNVTAKELVAFIPSIILGALIIWLTPFWALAKFIIVVFMFFIPFTLIFIRPVRDNIPAWKHIQERHRFHKRQKQYFYRKAGLYDITKKK